MKNSKLFKIIFMFLVVLFLAGCNNDKIKLKTIAPSIDTFQTYEVTNYMGHQISMELSETEILLLKEDMVYFYECKYYTADTTLTPMVQLTINTTENIKLDFIFAFDEKDNECYMLNINSVSYNIKVNKTFKKEHNFFPTLFSKAHEEYYQYM